LKTLTSSIWSRKGIPELLSATPVPSKLILTDTLVSLVTLFTSAILAPENNQPNIEIQNLKRGRSKEKEEKPESIGKVEVLFPLPSTKAAVEMFLGGFNEVRLWGKIEAWKSGDVGLDVILWKTETLDDFREGNGRYFECNWVWGKVSSIEIVGNRCKLLW